jgi:hypothetical protein
MNKKSPDTLLADIRLISEERHSTVQAVRSLAQRLFSPLTEEVKYGGILFTSDVPFSGVFAYKEHVSVEFSCGADIDDALGLLEGDGKHRRHLKLRSLADIDAKHVAHYLPLALAAAQARRA